VRDGRGDGVGEGEKGRGWERSIAVGVFWGLE